MITQLSQEEIEEYGSNATTIAEPVGVNYTRGVQVGRTAPAKWWNWLFNSVTKRERQARADAENILTELQNVVTDSGAELDPEDDTQLSRAVDDKADAAVTRYIDKEKRLFMSEWVATKATVNDFPVVQVRGMFFKFNSSESNEVYASKDAVTWVDCNIRSNFTGKLVYFKGKFYIVAGSDSLYSSTDGFTWSKITVTSGLPAYTNFSAPVRVFNDEYIVAKYNNTLYVSADGTVWSSVTLSYLNAVYTTYMYYQDGVYYLFGTGSLKHWLLSSTDLLTWTTVKEEAYGSNSNLVPLETNGKFIVQFAGKLYAFEDIGDTETWHQLDLSDDILASYGVAYGLYYVNNTYILIARSTDSKNFICCKSQDCVNFTFGFYWYNSTESIADIDSVCYTEGYYFFNLYDASRRSNLSSWKSSDLTSLVKLVSDDVITVTLDDMSTLSVSYIVEVSPGTFMAVGATQGSSVHKAAYKTQGDTYWHLVRLILAGDPAMSEDTATFNMRFINQWYPIGNEIVAFANGGHADYRARYITDKKINSVVDGVLYLK